MKNDSCLRTAYKLQAIIVSIIKARFTLPNYDEDTAVIRNQIDEALHYIACAAKSLMERGLFTNGDNSK